jgi:hypothetical protein
MSRACLEAIARAFQFARELGRECGPVDFLVGISAGDGAAAAALDPGAGRTLRAIVAAAGGSLGSGAGYLHMQAQGAARLLARARGEQMDVEHLLIALLDQGTPEVLEALGQAGLERAAVRAAALSAVGAPADQPALAFPALTPAGTLDRPPLPVADLDTRAWAVLRWRQDHLPLAKVRRGSDRQALLHLERGAAWRLADRLGVDDDQRYSLIRRHADEVEQRAVRGSELAGPRGQRGGRAGTRAVPPRRRRHRLLRNVTVGWRAWFSNRRVGLRDRWFRLRTLRDYRDCPQP